MMRWLPMLLLAGCTQDPVYYGIWSMDEVSFGPATTEDAGFIEIYEEGAVVVVFSRYRPVGGEFVPEREPELVTGNMFSSSTGSDDYFSEKDETYTLSLSPFAATFDVVEFGPNVLSLETPRASWLGEAPPLGETAEVDQTPMTLQLSR